MKENIVFPLWLIYNVLPVILAHAHQYLRVVVALRIEPGRLPLIRHICLTDPTGFARIVTEELIKVVSVKRNWWQTQMLPSDWLKPLRFSGEGWLTVCFFELLWADGGVQERVSFIVPS